MPRSERPLRSRAFLYAAYTAVAALACRPAITPLPLPVPVEPPPAAPLPARDSSPAPLRADSTRRRAEWPPTVLPSIRGPRRTPDAAPSAPGIALQNDRSVRIALVSGVESVRLSATGGWRIVAGGGEYAGGAGEEWVVQVTGGRLRVAGPGAAASRSYSGQVTATPADASTFVALNGRRYRGELVLVATAAGMTVVNSVPVESYLRGVVPLEIGTDRTSVDEAAVQAQAVAARSYAYSHFNQGRSYDMLATVADQVYGGVDAERPVADAAVESTAGLVLVYDGRVASTPYSSSCGGSTAAASELWRGGSEPYLVPVSDRVPGTGRFYCDISPTFRWTRSYDEQGMRDVLDRYLRKYASGASGSVGPVRAIRETGRSASGRVTGIAVTMERGNFTVRANDVRSVLRNAGGAILNSTSFDIEQASGSDGHLERLVLRGTGNGHGVGMCQWGAIGRARAGQDYRTILATYYPGTTLQRII